MQINHINMICLFDWNFFILFFFGLFSAKFLFMFRLFQWKTFFKHFLVFGRIEDTDDPETNLLVNRIHFGKMFAPYRKFTKQSILILSFSTHFNLLHQR